MRFSMGFGVVLIAAASPALSETSVYTGFLETHGCTYGPKLDAEVRAAGLTPEGLASHARTAVQAGTAEHNGDWVVFDASVCTIKLPEITSTYEITDDVLASHITSVSDPAYEAGCYLTDWQQAFEATGHDADAAFAEGVGFLASEITAGRMSFYSDSPLRTPFGFQTVVPEGCDQGARAEAIKASSGDLAELFDTYVRMSYAANTCGDGQSGDMAFAKTVKDRTDNAWMFMDAMMLTLAAGWHEGMTAQDKGMPRPPLCHIAP
ncbi:hypothetical protein [Celeribacter sp.]|uniref:hypothetical protein n=1 Tax=Celeribacter sp. TaxID=1890673 RepID=UPI003A940E05